jgi:hypothetical protein
MSSWKSREMDRGGGEQSIWGGVVTWAEQTTAAAGAFDLGGGGGGALFLSFPLPYQERM